MSKLLIAIVKIGIVLLVLFAATFTVYFGNFDMKLERKIYDKLQPHYDNLEKDRKL